MICILSLSLIYKGKRVYLRMLFLTLRESTRMLHYIKVILTIQSEFFLSHGMRKRCLFSFP